MTAVSTLKHLERWVFCCGRLLFVFVLATFLSVGGIGAQTTSAPIHAESPVASLAESTNAVSPARFVAVHGRRALLDGYAATGLEMWAYPVEVLDQYRVSFREAGTTSDISGHSILRRVVYRPDSVTRIYIGPDFVVRERLFVPLHQTAALISYRVSGVPSLQVHVHFRPVLNLMWPAGIGGQETAWQAQADGYVLSEPTHRFSAVIGSTAVVAHDPVYNRPQVASDTSGPGFSITAGATPAVVVMAAGDGDLSALQRQVVQMTDAAKALEQRADAHYRALLKHALVIDTPDATMNRELQWAQVALDQAWVCNPQLGCGLVAGYGPSRGARRPQYAWFFAGDAMTAIDALLAEGQYARARDTLEFIGRYQDQKTGMIWHEMSQSAGLIDWVHDYPYMFVHVDISFQYLETVERYVAASGDMDFLQTHWNSIAAAYRYCASLVGNSGLPEIPASKEGGDEQDRMRDELTLSAAWVRASEAYSQMAAWHGETAGSAAAHAASERARVATAQHYWDPRAKFWIDGYTAPGKPILHHSSNGNAALRDGIFSSAQQHQALDALASATFQTDWGTRSVPTDSPAYQPGSYATGSVWAVGTANVAQSFWNAGRSATANEIWSTLIAWPQMNALGHMDEVLAGDTFHEQTESVPEQTWSSAAFLRSAVQGMLGLRVNAKNHEVQFAPQPPPDWQHLSVENVRIGNSAVELRWQRMADGSALTVRSSGPPFRLDYTVALPAGAKLANVLADGKPVASDSTLRGAHVRLLVRTGTSVVRARFTGGVAVAVPRPDPKLGDDSRGLKVVRAQFANGEYILTLDADASRSDTLDLLTPWHITAVDGAQWKPAGDARYHLTLSARPAAAGYHRVMVRVHLQTQ